MANPAHDETSVAHLTRRKNPGTPIDGNPSLALPGPAETSNRGEGKNIAASDDPKTEKAVSPVPNQGPQIESQPVVDSTNKPGGEQIKSVPDSGKAAGKIVTAPNRKSGFSKGFEIAIVGAPDMSNVKFTNSDKVGFNAGLQIGYRISQRLSLNTGVIYTKKNYTAQGKDFDPPKGSWLDNVQLEMVKGNCYMFDVPLNIRYDLNTNSTHRYFLSTGLSTYLMSKEDYHYHYQYPNGSPGYRYRSYPSSEHHWLSIVNISAGFEKKLNKRLALQVEPYLKVPLAGVGYGNLQLNSYGVYFSLKFQTRQ